MYSLGFRIAALKLYEHFHSMKKVSMALNISLSTIWNWLHKGIEFKKRTKLLISNSVVQSIKNFLLLHPTTTHLELSNYVIDQFNIVLSRRCIASILRHLKFTKKRLRLRGLVSKERTFEEIKKFNTNYKQSSKVFAVDECGFDFKCLPLYGYSPKGVKAIIKEKSTSNRTRTSLIMGISTNGEYVFKINEGPTNTKSFGNFVDLCPKECSILLDNASIHKTKFLKDKALYNDQKLLFIPPYTPECNPIENVFSVIKNLFRKKLIDLNTKRLPHKEILCNIIQGLDTSIFSKCFNHMEKWVENYLKDSYIEKT
jgi:transposase